MGDKQKSDHSSLIEVRAHWQHSTETIEEMKVWEYCQGNGRDRQDKLKEKNASGQRSRSFENRPLEKIPRKEKKHAKALSLESKICFSHDNFME